MIGTNWVTRSCLPLASFFLPLPLFVVQQMCVLRYICTCIYKLQCQEGCLLWRQCLLQEMMQQQPTCFILFGGEFLNCLCTRRLKTTFDNGSKEFPFNTFSTLISLIDGSSMMLNETNFQVHSKTTCKSTRKGKGKTKGLAKGTKEGTKEVKERKKGRRVSTTTRIILRTQCSILMKT
jgi:hypothetical protein